MYSKGISWIDDCRIPTISQKEINWTPQRQSKNPNIDLGGMRAGQEQSMYNSKGRFPANLLVSDDMLNDGIKPNKGHRSKSKVSGYGEFGGGKSEYHGIGEYMNVDSTSRYYDIDKWFDKIIE